MNSRPQFSLRRLREIGWSRWDPIGLAGDKDANDEYDSYLLQAAGRLWNGASADEVANFLIGVETEHMGLGPGNPTAVRQRASEVANALSLYVIELRR